MLSSEGKSAFFMSRGKMTTRELIRKLTDINLISLEILRELNEEEDKRSNLKVIEPTFGKYAKATPKKNGEKFGKKNPKGRGKDK